MILVDESSHALDGLDGGYSTSSGHRTFPFEDMLDHVRSTFGLGPVHTIHDFSDPLHHRSIRPFGRLVLISGIDDVSEVATGDVTVALLHVPFLRDLLRSIQREVNRVVFPLT